MDKNLYKIINNYNKDQIILLKMVVNFYKENNCPKMNFNNEIQINNLINYLFNPNSEFTYKTDFFNYIKHDKRRKRIKFIYNSDFSSFKYPIHSFLIDIPLFFTNKELYSIAKIYKEFESTKMLLIHKNKILKNDESPIDEISNGDIIWVIENKLYPDSSYYFGLQNKYSKMDIINISVHFDNGAKMVYNLSGEVTIKELIRAIIEHKGYSLDNLFFLYNASKLNPDDMRKIKELNLSNVMDISCERMNLLRNILPPIGKEIFANGNAGSYPIGTLDPILKLFDILGVVRGKIIIENIEFDKKSDNYLSFYGINKDFIYTIKNE